MEPQELTVEKNELFGSLMRWFSKRAIVSKITFVIFCLLAGLCVFCAVLGYVDWPPCIVGCIICIVVGGYDMIWYHKLAKANDAQEFLTIYDKVRKREKWTTLTCALFLIAIVIGLIIIKANKEQIILFAALMSLYIIGGGGGISDTSPKRDVDRLRELVHQS